MIRSLIRGLPREILESRRAVVWKVEHRDGRVTKVPFQAARPAVRAAVNRPATWGTFAEAVATVRRGQADGVGVVLGAGLVGVDLDHCMTAGAITDAALGIIRALDSYTESSPSGTGVHVLLRGVLPPGRRRTADGVELYDALRFFTVTGRRVVGTRATIEERTAALAALHARVFPPPAAHPHHGSLMPPVGADAGLLARARAARNGTKFARLWAGDTTGYRSPSEADLALVALLAFWTHGDPARVDRLFRSSGLYRPKWDAARGGQTYGARTIATALAGRVACHDATTSRPHVPVRLADEGDASPRSRGARSRRER
jgi:putative DNA primase/helicase